MLFDALRTSGYLKPKTSAYTEGKIRRRVRALNLSRLDTEAWIGMLRQMLWKMRRESGPEPKPEPKRD